VLDTTSLAPGQEAELEALNADIRKLYELAPSAGKRVNVAIIGHTDQLGTEESNMRLSRDRADAVRSLLVKSLGDRILLTTAGAGAKEPVREERTDLDKETNRSVTVRITLTDVS
jgi:outer membrane protein OmpA-like peptidoglycan-associated protein